MNRALLALLRTQDIVWFLLSGAVQLITGPKTMGRNDEDWAAFWRSLPSPVFLGGIPEAQRKRYFRELSQQERQLPNGQRRRIFGTHLPSRVAWIEGRRRAGVVPSWAIRSLKTATLDFAKAKS